MKLINIIALIIGIVVFLAFTWLVGFLSRALILKYLFRSELPEQNGNIEAIINIIFGIIVIYSLKFFFGLFNF